MPHTRILIMAALALLVLTGCSRAGPSDSEVEAALKARVAGHDMGSMQIDSVKKSRCVATGAPDAFACDVEVALGGATAGKGTSHLSLAKENGVWTVVGAFSMQTGP